MKRVIIESPFAGDTEKHLGYVYRCIKDSLMRGESPYASHVLYTRVLDDRDPVQREIGIQAGLSWAVRADLTAVYTDFGVTEGMQRGIDHARECGREIEYRTVKGAASIPSASSTRGDLDSR